MRPGPIVLLGSGETAPNAQKIYHRLFSEIADEVRVAILETPAGFEPNSDYVARQVGRYIEQRLQNFKPSITVVPARKKATAFSPDDPEIVAQLFDANVIFMGPGSPTYTARQMQDSLAWHTMRASHRMGAALVLASAATLAVSRHTMPIYEIYKVGEDLHWKDGLNLFADFDLDLVFVSHWNNNDGGEVLDTSRCYLGQDRFGQMLSMLPGGVDAYTLVGIDENTALIVQPADELCTVVGVGSVKVIRHGQTKEFPAGQKFAMRELGAFRLPAGSEGIPDAVWEATVRGRQAAADARQQVPEPDAELLSLVERRTSARARRDWDASDRLRDQIAARGWHVRDTPAGPVVEPVN